MSYCLYRRQTTRERDTWKMLIAYTCSQITWCTVMNMGFGSQAGAGPANPDLSARDQALVVVRLVYRVCGSVFEGSRSVIAP